MKILITYKRFYILFFCIFIYVRNFTLLKCFVEVTKEKKNRNIAERHFTYLNINFIVTVSVKIMTKLILESMTHFGG